MRHTKEENRINQNCYTQSNNEYDNMCTAKNVDMDNIRLEDLGHKMHGTISSLQKLCVCDMFLA